MNFSHGSNMKFPVNFFIFIVFAHGSFSISTRLTWHGFEEGTIKTASIDTKASAIFCWQMRPRTDSQNWKLLLYQKSPFWKSAQLLNSTFRYLSENKCWKFDFEIPSTVILGTMRYRLVLKRRRTFSSIEYGQSPNFRFILEDKDSFHQKKTQTLLMRSDKPAAVEKTHKSMQTDTDIFEEFPNAKNEHKNFLFWMAETMDLSGEAEKETSIKRSISALPFQ
jgi:hypothetical protein